MRYTFLDANFFDFYNIPLKYGTSFLPDSEGDQRTSVILNEAAFSAFRFEARNDNVIAIGDFKVDVVGIVNDFNFESLQNEVAPTLMFHRTPSNASHRFISCKMNFENLPEKLLEIERLWNNMEATNPFTYSFMDDRVETLYQSENRYLGMVTMFSSLSILVACLGLYGLTLFIIEKRRKEISIRKVLGAEINKILGLIFKDFTRWIVLAFIISVPFAVLFIQNWLKDYHYQISISWMTFLATLAIVFGLVIMTVGYQSVRAATSNPVNHLKDE